MACSGTALPLHLSLMLYVQSSNMTWNFVHSMSINYVKFQVIMAWSMKMTDFWDIVLCNHTKVDQCFRGYQSDKHL
jgi:hypothetical protein